LRGVDDWDESHPMMRRAAILTKSVFALLLPGSFIDALVDADYIQDLSRNSALRTSTPAQLVQFRDTVRVRVSDRLRLLRVRLTVGFLFIGSAAVLALFVNPRSNISLGHPSASVLAVVSIFCFAWATLGRLGWAGQSYKGDTSVERLDQAIFWVLYWLGTFFGVLAAT
jgi:hypothetical protein